MRSNAEKKVSDFYNTVGWEPDDGVYEDARRWEDLRDCSASYISRCRLRVLDHIPASGDRMLDMASGPIQYPEYLEYSRGFEKRYCVDLSADALEHAERRIGDRGAFLQGSFFDLELDEDSFDCSVSLHTIYHMDKDQQEAAVRKLIDVTRPGQPVVVVYSNPDSFGWLARAVMRARRLPSKLRRVMRREPRPEPEAVSVYFFAHPLSWWERFDDVADVRIFPWRSLEADYMKATIPDNRLGKAMLDWLMKAEDRFPRFFARHGQYPMIVLTKRD